MTYRCTAVLVHSVFAVAPVFGRNAIRNSKYLYLKVPSQAQIFGSHPAC